MYRIGRFGDGGEFESLDAARRKACRLLPKPSFVKQIPIYKDRSGIFGWVEYPSWGRKSYYEWHRFMDGKDAAIYRLNKDGTLGVRLR